jgi:CO/xanthine dehydrogenase FAD-binding subunit
MRNFCLARTLDEARSLLAQWGDEALLCAGGTDLMVALRNKSLAPGKTCLIDIGRVPELSFIRESDDWVEIGSGTTHAAVAASGLVAASSLILGDAARSVGSPQVRNRGTLGGNILTAAQCADTIPSLLVLDAELLLLKPDGTTRRVPLAGFFPKPKETAIGPGEILLSIRYRSLAGSAWRGSYYKLIRRAAVAKSRLSFATLARVGGSGLIEGARISIGSTLPTPGRFGPAEALLKGKAPSWSLVEEAAEVCASYMIEKAGWRWSTEYKQPVVKNVIKRELAAVLGLETSHAE